MFRLGSLLALLLLGAAPASAAGQNGTRFRPTPVAAEELADAMNAVAPAAANGHVVFSRLLPATGRFELVAWSAATGLRVLPVGDRAVFFDADVGPTQDGGALLTWSRCRKDAVAAFPGPSVDFSAARGCRLWSLRLDAAGARPRRLRLRGDAALSLTTPSARDGAVAAVASPARGSRNVRILFWSDKARRPVRLRGGTADCPPDDELYLGCEGGPRTSVAALDLGARSVAFTWRNPIPGYGTAGGVELRSSGLARGDDAYEVPYADGYVSDGGGRLPASPAARADGGLGFLVTEEPSGRFQTTFGLAPPGARPYRGVRPSGAVALGAAFDGGRTYWLRGRDFRTTLADENPYDGDVPCAAPGADCRLVVSRALPFAAPPRRR